MPPGLLAQLGAIRIFGVINVLSDKRRFGNAFATRRKLLSGDDGELPNHQPPRTPEPVIQNTSTISTFNNQQFYGFLHLNLYLSLDVCLSVGSFVLHHIYMHSGSFINHHGIEFNYFSFPQLARSQAPHIHFKYSVNFTLYTIFKHVPVEFFRAISSALDVLRWSMRKLGILNGGTCILSDEN